AARGLLEEAVDRVHIPMGQGIGGRIAVTRAPLIVNDLSTSDLDGLHPVLRERLRALVGVPLLVEKPIQDHEEATDTARVVPSLQPVEGRLVSQLVGVISMGSAAPRRFTEADVELLQHAADRIALAIGRAHLYAAEQEARKRAEEALARAQASEAQAAERAERLHTILETMTDGVA